MKRCCNCGKPIHGLYWWRHWNGIEVWCNECAAEHVDDTTAFGLMLAWED